MRRAALNVLAGAVLLGVCARPGGLHAAPVPPARVTHVFDVRHGDVTRFQDLYLRLAGPEAAVVAEPRTRRLVVSDRPERLERLLVLLRALDRPDGESYRIYVRPIRHRAAAELAAAVTPLAQALGGILTLTPDPATEQWIVVATPDAYRRLDALVRRLDVPARGGPRIWVVPGS